METVVGRLFSLVDVPSKHFQLGLAKLLCVIVHTGKPCLGDMVRPKKLCFSLAGRVANHKIGPALLHRVLRLLQEPVRRDEAAWAPIRKCGWAGGAPELGVQPL